MKPSRRRESECLDNRAVRCAVPDRRATRRCGAGVNQRATEIYADGYKSVKDAGSGCSVSAGAPHSRRSSRVAPDYLACFTRLRADDRFLTSQGRHDNVHPATCRNQGFLYYLVVMGRKRWVVSARMTPSPKRASSTRRRMHGTPEDPAKHSMQSTRCCDSLFRAKRQAS